MDDYYEDFVKLSRHAPLMTKNQKLSQFMISLEGQLAKEVNAFQPNSLVDALIGAKAKLLSFQVGEHKRKNPYPPPSRVLIFIFNISVHVYCKLSFI